MALEDGDDDLDWDERDELERLQRMEAEILAQRKYAEKMRNRPLAEKAFDFVTSNLLGQLIVFIGGPLILYIFVQWWLMAPDYMGFWEWLAYEPEPRW